MSEKVMASPSALSGEIDKLARLLNENCGEDAEYIIVEAESPCGSEDCRTQRSAEKS